ncbi:MAG TPA: hypothetical protein VF511_05850 [Chthoniobacterales bacterium]
MTTKYSPQEQGSTLVVTIAVVATLLVLLGAAVEYTSQIARIAQRSRKTAIAMEIADGHLEMLFASWRNIYRGTWTTGSNYSGGTDYSILGGNYFFTTMYNPGPAPTPIPNMNPAATPSPIPTPARSLFPSEPGYQLTQYRIQGVDPMINLDANENALHETSYGSESYVPLSPAATPPAAYGQNTWQYSFFYLASVDVKVPSSGGEVMAKVRRVFEKKFDNPWTFAVLYMDDLEFQPSTALTVNGRIHTNGGLYIGTSNFTAQNSVGFAAEYVNGYSPNDTSNRSGSITEPTFPTDMPPVQVSPYLPFGWVLNLNNSGGNLNDDSYHELIERPQTGTGITDPLASIRLFNQAAYRVLIDSSSNITITDSTGAAVTGNAYNAITGAMTINQAIKDQRENTYVRLTNVDVTKIKDAIAAGKLPGVTATNAGGNTIGNVFYFSDTTPNGTSVTAKMGGSTSVATTERAIRLINGTVLPSDGLTIVAENPIYIQGNYNTGGASPPSNSGNYTDPDVSGYTRVYAAVIGDSINVLSSAWNDNNSAGAISGRTAANTTINAALVGGNVPSGGGYYSGGGENFIRLLEDWKSATFCYYGSMVQLFKSVQGTGIWTGSGTNYKAPLTTKIYWDPLFASGAPPGRLQIAAYLQQQRWYQVY